MAIAPITQWLDSREKNYLVGRALYEQYGTNSLLKTLFKNGDSDYHLTRLIESLEELNRQLHAIDQKQQPQHQRFVIPPLESIPVPATRMSLSDPAYQNAPEEIKDLYTANSRLNSRADLLYLQARSAPTAAERLELSLAQLDDRQQVNENWQTIKEYHATGVVQEQVKEAEEKNVSELTVSELMALDKNLPTYISKARKSLQALQAGTPKFIKTANRLQQYTIKLKLVKERLDNV
jgi:hypothetical protein